jgi:hypothetical protein
VFLSAVSLDFSPLDLRIDLNGGLKANRSDGCWVNSFGVTGLNICDVKVGLSVLALPPFVARISFQGKLSSTRANRPSRS